MRKLIQVLLLFYFVNISFSQNKDVFKIDSVLTTEENLTKLRPSKENDNPLFEDDKYVITSLCNGEFGGVIIFKDKRTGFEYGCEATCAVIINKVRGKYIVTNSLAHMGGNTKIIEITNPQRLTRLTKGGDRKLKIYNLKKAKKGTKVLISKYSVLTLSSFQSKNNLYHIISDRKKTYISKIVDGEFLNQQIISNQRIWNYNSNNIIKNNHQIFFFLNREFKGYITIFENNIKVHYIPK